MFFLIPTSTDAPIYHFPFGTIGLIVANVVCFAATGFALNPERLEPWILEYGNGLNPVQWLSSSFAHAGFSHLIGNMIFLWCFGLVVEGKLGWYRFIPMYLGIGIASGAITDVLTLWQTEGGCLGASDVIFGLMAISLVWAPKNEVHFVGFFMFFGMMLIPFARVFSFDITIMTLSIWYFGFEVVELLIWPSFGTSMLHLLGAVVGFPVGVLFLKKGWVDCEKWDLFAVMSGKYGRFAEEDWALGAHGRPAKVYGDVPVPEASDDAESETANRASSARRKKHQAAISQIDQLIDSGDFLTAADELFTLRMQDETICPNSERTRKLAVGLLQAQAFDEAELWLQEFIDRYPEQNAWARVRMAQLLLTQRQRPNAAVQQLKGLKAEDLTEQLRTLAKKIAAAAKEQIRNGVKDAESEW